MRTFPFVGILTLIPPALLLRADQVIARPD